MGVAGKERKAMGLADLRQTPSWGWGEGVEGVPHHPKLHSRRRYRSSCAQYEGRLEGNMGAQLNLMEETWLDEGCFLGNSQLHNIVTALVLGSPSQMEEAQFPY